MRRYGQHSQVCTPPRSLEWSGNVVPVPARIGTAILSVNAEPRSTKDLLVRPRASSHWISSREHRAKASPSFSPRLQGMSLRFSE
jgi:hypothetical protein